MKAIILAGGLGTRLRPVTYETPKPLITVRRKPILNYLVELFGRHGVREVAVVIRPDDRAEFEWWLRRWQGQLNGVRVSFAEEPEPMGTLGYLAHTLHAWAGSEPFYFTNGDELKEMDLTAMLAHHTTQHGLGTIALVQVPNPHEYGVPVLKGDAIVDFLEKPASPPSNFINSGLYVLEPKALAYVAEDVRDGKKFLMVEKDLFPRLAKDGKLMAYRGSGRWYDCGTLERWDKAIKEWPNGNTL